MFVALNGLWFLVSMWFGLIVQGPYHPELDTKGPSLDTRCKFLFPSCALCFIVHSGHYYLRFSTLNTKKIKKIRLSDYFDVLFRNVSREQR